MRLLGSGSTRLLLLASVVVGVSSLMAGVNAPAARASSGGGCWSEGNTQVSACISASGSHLEPDLYVLNNSNCQSVEVIVADITSNKVIWSDDNVTSGCTLGVHGPWALDSANTDGGLVSGHEYYTTVYMILANSSVYDVGAVSPTETFVP